MVEQRRIERGVVSAEVDLDEMEYDEGKRGKRRKLYVMQDLRTPPTREDSYSSSSSLPHFFFFKKNFFVAISYHQASETWTSPCRCGQEYVVSVEDLEEGIDVIGCAGCSLRIRVLYEEEDASSSIS